jgi:hypothetical protein
MHLRALGGGQTSPHQRLVERAVHLDQRHAIHGRRLSFDHGFERQLCGKLLCGSAAGCIPRELRFSHRDTGFDGRSRIVGLELEKLPLPREEPHRIPRFGAKCTLEVLRSRASFEPTPSTHDGLGRERHAHGQLNGKQVEWHVLMVSGSL